MIPRVSGGGAGRSAAAPPSAAALTRLDLAREQLREIEALCGTSCEYYVELAEVLDAAQ